jgi:hypothetical protein
LRFLPVIRLICGPALNRMRTVIESVLTALSAIYSFSLQQTAIECWIAGKFYIGKEPVSSL